MTLERIARSTVLVRAAVLVAALVVMIAPLPYLDRTGVSIGLTMEHDVVHNSHDRLVFADTLDAEHGEKREHTVILWWVVAAAMLAWTVAEQRRRPRTYAIVIRAVLVSLATLLVLTRSFEILRFGHIAPLAGSHAIDIAVVAYALAMIAGAIVGWRAARITR